MKNNLENTYYSVDFRCDLRHCPFSAWKTLRTHRYGGLLSQNHLVELIKCLKYA